MAPKLIPEIPEPAQKRFWRLVDKQPDHWLWLGSPDRHGKGVFRVNRTVKVYAHRVSWIICNGPTTRPVRLTCGNVVCVNPSHMELGRTAVEVRFWKFVQQGSQDACWPWTGGQHNQGYGQFQLASHLLVKSHRVAFELTTGISPEGLEVMHSCDNPPCCNPAHLTLGTHQENIQDAISKGRVSWNHRGRFACM